MFLDLDRCNYIAVYDRVNFVDEDEKYSSTNLFFCD